MSGSYERNWPAAKSLSGRRTVYRAMRLITGMRFADTNVLLYSLSTHPDETGKADIARRLLDDDDLCLSVQVLQEFYVQATRTSRSGPLSHDEAVALIQTWLRFPVQEVTVALMQAALATSARWGLSYWDAAVIEAARLQACDVLLSEDLSAGQNYGGVRVVNPFQPAVAG